MNQQALHLNRCTRRTRKIELLELMGGVVPWREFVAQLTVAAPPKTTGRPPFAHENMLRLHLLQQLFGQSGLAMEEALFFMPMYRTLSGSANTDRLPDRGSILRFRHLMEKHDLANQFFETVNDMLRAKDLMLKSGTVVDATTIATSSSTKNSTGKRDPERHHQTKKGNQWHHGMKAHIGADTDSGLVHTVADTAANVNDVTQAHAPVHGNEADVYAVSGVAKHEELQEIDTSWHIEMRPSKRQALDKQSPLGAASEKIEQLKASIRAKVDPPFQVIKRQFGHTEVRYCELKKNTAQLFKPVMLPNQWMVRNRFMQASV